MPPLENQPVKQPQDAAYGYQPPPLYVFTGDGNNNGKGNANDSKTPSLYQFSGDAPVEKSGPYVPLGPVGKDWGPRIGPSERRIDQMPEGPEKQRALSRETNVLFNVPVALKAYRDDIKAADAIDQTDVARRNTDNTTLLKQNEAQIAQAKAANATPEQMNALVKKQEELQTNQKTIINDYYAPATTRINAGLALVSTGQDMLVDYGQNLIDEGLKLRPELRDNPDFQKSMVAARKECIKNRENAFSGEMNNPYQFSGDGSVPGGIPPKKPGVPGQPGRGADGKPLPGGNPGFTPIPGYDAPPQPATPFPTFKRGGETPDSARNDKPKPQPPVENFNPPAQAEKPKGVDKSVWDQTSTEQKLLAAALAAFLGYKLVQRGNRIAAEKSRDAGNEALGKSPENTAKLKEAIERAGLDIARDNIVKAQQVKEGEHAGKYEVTGPDGKKTYLSEAEFKEKYTETGKPGEFKGAYSDKAKAVRLPELGELNAELGLGKQADRKIWAVTENGEVKLLTDKEFKSTWRTPTDADKTSWKKEAESKLTPEEKAAKEKAAAEKLAAEQKAAEEKAAAEKLAAEQKAAEEKAAAEKLAAEQKAAEEKAAAEKLAAEQKAAEEKAAAEKLAAEQKAAEEKAAAEKLAAEQKAAEEKAAAEKLAAEQKAAEEKAAAEKLAAEQKAAEEKAAAEKLAAEQKAAEEKAAAEKLAEQKAAEEKAAAEKLAAEQKAAEEKAATEKLAAEQKAAEEKAAAEKLAAEQKAAEEKAAAEKLAAEQKAAAERFKPAAGTEIVPGIKVDQKVSVEGVNWTAAGKIEDRIVFKKDSGIERSKTPQEMKPADFNRVEIAGEKGIYFQRKGTNTLYQYIPMDGKQGLEPGAGNGFMFKLDGVEAKPLGSPVVRAMLKAGVTTPEVTAPAPVKEEVKAPESGTPTPAESKRSKRGPAPTIGDFGGVEYQQNTDGTQSQRLEVAGKPLVGTEKNWKELLTEPEVKAIQERKVELEKAQKERALAAEEVKELDALRNLEPKLDNPKTHAEIIERLGGKRPTGGFRAGELRGGLIGGAILATAVLGWFAGNHNREEYRTPERSRLGGN